MDGTLVYLPATDEDRKLESARRLMEQQLRPVFKAITDLKRRAPDGVITTRVLASSLEAGAKKKRAVEELARVVEAREKWLQRQVWDGKKQTYGPLRLWVLQDDITGKPITPYIWIDASTEDVEDGA